MKTGKQSTSMEERLASISWTGSALARPECVLATRGGSLFVADWRGGVTHLKPDGSQISYLAQACDGEAMKPNGIALRSDGSFLIAHLGDETGGLFHLHRNGQCRPLLRQVEGQDLPPSNFVLEDHQQRIWLTVSTRLQPRALGYRKGCNDGFIAVLDRRGARIVADGLGYTNEVAVDPSGRWLYANETFARRLSRFELRDGGALGPRETVAEFGPGTFPDGLCFDADGDAWITSIVSNRLLCVGRDGRQTIWLEDADPAHLAAVEQAWEEDRMGREHLDKGTSRCLRNASSLAFGGADLRTGYIGCLLGDSLATIAMPVAGHPPFHWNYA